MSSEESVSEDGFIARSEDDDESDGSCSYQPEAEDIEAGVAEDVGIAKQRTRRATSARTNEKIAESIRRENMSDVDEALGDEDQHITTMSYEAGIIKAVNELMYARRFSPAVIKEHMQGNLPAHEEWMNDMYLAALAKLVATGDLVKIKASYKLGAGYFEQVAVAAAKTKKAAAPKKKGAATRRLPPLRRRLRPRRRQPPGRSPYPRRSLQLGRRPHPRKIP